MNDHPKLSQARVSQTDVAVLYDRLAWMYDPWGIITESKARRRSLELAAIADGQRVLEVAIGTGLAFEHVVRSNPGGRNVGIDLSNGMLAKAERRLQKAGLSNFELSVGSALRIEQGTGEFDVVLNSYLFDLLTEEHWPNVLAEFHRVLKPGGKLVLVNMTLGERFGSGIFERLYRMSPALMGGCRGVLMIKLVEQSGFTVHSREYFQQMLFPSEVILASRHDESC